ncbi:hypothetical protein FJT64_017694 [Amphibalanus amphitrite]|uniref:C-type lectin domain-containing protein n=1 Tax=Amphibalanus amphitrite TaxID=1232801 RepID=A0A6A4X213_AMPAM|nr:hypothetical protein FJT64_017694 [Amphibalanus amphitrite]
MDGAGGRLLLLLLPLLLAAGVSARLFRQTAGDQAFTGVPLQVEAGGWTTLCAIHCARNPGCAAMQPSGDSSTTTTTTPPCPSDWTVIGTACYFIASPGNSESLWQDDSDYCAAQFGTRATLPAFETSSQYSFFVNKISGRVWMNIRYVNGQFSMFGGSSSTYWQNKWDMYEPGSADNGFVFFYGAYDTLWAVPIDPGPMPRTQVVCMIYMG